MAGAFVVFTDAVEGREEEFNHWYDKVHLPEILALPSFTGARRFTIERDLEGEFTQKYLAIYEVTDSRRAFDELAAARPNLTMSGSLNQETVLRSYYGEIEGEAP